MQPAVVIARARNIYQRRAAALLGLCVVLRIVSLVRLCQSDDEATYAVVAREMLTGHALYLDAADHKPPAIYITYEVTQAIAGPIGGMVLLHALLIGVGWATGLLLAGIVRRYGPSRDARVPWFAARGASSWRAGCRLPCEGCGPGILSAGSRVMTKRPCPVMFSRLRSSASS